MSNLVVSLAIIGKNNEPLYLKEFIERKIGSPQQGHFDEGELFGIVPPNNNNKAASLPPSKESSPSSDAANNNVVVEGAELQNDLSETSEYDDEDDDFIVESGTATFKAIRISLKQEFILHAALDRFEQLSGPPPGYAWRRGIGNTTGSDNHHPMYMGLLCPVEDLRVYGYMTTTQIKFFVVIVDDPASSSSSHHHHHHSSSFPNNYDTQSYRSGTTSATSGTSSDMGSAALSIHSPTHHHHQQHLASLESHQHTDVLLQRLFVALHQCYVSYMLNPFSPLLSASPIISRRFDEQVQAVVTKHNRFCLSRK
ncbi:hypothetical protein ACA910_005252 [Epithemia clementina (nom. ined.)]